MNKTKLKLLTALLSATFLTTNILTPISAYSYGTQSGFSDIYDDDVDYSVSVLSGLGIIGGYPDGTFRPNDYLERSEFCKLAVYMLGIEDKVTSASQRTLFSDVTSSHWASGYINLAYENGLIRGNGDGTFGPENTLSYAETLTILLRMLDYTESDIGTVYPDDYISFADSLGLCESVQSYADEPLTRAQCAQLLVDCLTTECRNGSAYYEKLYPRSVDDVILLDADTTSDVGKKNTVRLYENGQSAWYQKAVDISADMEDSHGIALIDNGGKIVAFLPDGEKYSTVNGILLVNSRRSNGGELAYETVLFANGSEYVFPRANTISANLVGNSGTLILDENGYATSFLADDSGVYTITKNAVLTSIDDTAEFYINGKLTEFDLTYDSLIDSRDIGMTGMILTDENDGLYAFVPSAEDEYSIVYGTLTQNDGDTAEFLIDTSISEIEVEGSLSSAKVGQSGRLLINAALKLEAFFAEDDAGTVKTDAVLLSVGACTTGYSGTYSNMYAGIYQGIYSGAYYGYSYTYEAVFYINGKTEKYEISSGQLDSYSPGMSGTLILDDDENITAFYPDEYKYSVINGMLMSVSSSKAEFIMNGYTAELYISGTVASNLIGQSGMILLDKSGRVEAFVVDENADSTSLSQSGILLDVGKVAADGRTIVVTMYENGKLAVYRTNAVLSANYKGRAGKLLLNEDSTVVGFIEDKTNMNSVTVTSTDADKLLYSGGEYSVSANIPTVVGGTLTTWGQAYGEAVGENASIYFNELGSISVIVIE